MTSFVPSQIRTVRIYRERAPMRSRGLVGPSTRYRWPPKHALETEWWCVDATGWCQDIEDTLLAPPGVTITPADNYLSVVTTAISADGLQAGWLFSGGDPAKTSYTITVRLIGRTTGASWAGDINLPITEAVNVDPPPAEVSTMNGSVLTFGGITLKPGPTA